MIQSKKNRLLIINNNIKVVWLIFLFFILLTSSFNAQTKKTTPTPNSEIPKIVSRDTDSAKTIGEDVNEISDPSSSTNTISLPVPKTLSRTLTNELSTEKQQKMILYLDLLTKTEERASSLRKQLFEMIEKQNSITTKIKQLDYLLRPEIIASSTALTGSLRPEDLREQRKQSLELEKANIEQLLLQIENSRANLEENVRKADALVEKIRTRFDVIVDIALREEEEIENN
jgi:hypothetical protein